MVINNALPTAATALLHLFCVDAMDDDQVSFPGRTIGGNMPNVKSTRDIVFGNRSTWTGHWSPPELRKLGFDLDALDVVIAETVARGVRSYLEDFVHLRCVPRFRDSGYQLQRYTKGEGFYAEHVDGSPMAESFRVLAVVIYLNTVDRGGETLFPDHGAAVHPIAGRMAIFPAAWTHPHVAAVPLSDDKYIISTFISPEQKP